MEYIHRDMTFDKTLENVEIASDYVMNNIRNKSQKTITITNSKSNTFNLCDTRLYLMRSCRRHHTCDL
mgnify:CR=1 FL=1